MTISTWGFRNSSRAEKYTHFQFLSRTRARSASAPLPLLLPSSLFSLLLSPFCVARCVCVPVQGKAICCGLCCKGIFGGIRLETHLKHCLVAVANRKNNNNRDNSNTDNNKLQLQRKKRTKHILFKVTGAAHRLWHSRNPALANKGCALLSIDMCVSACICRSVSLSLSVCACVCARGIFSYCCQVAGKRFPHNLT